MRFELNAVCTDQSNVKERSYQANMIRSIYAKADQVLCWLGPASEADGNLLQNLLKQIDGAIDFIAALGQAAMKRGVAVGGFPVDLTVSGSKQIYLTRDNKNFYPPDEWLQNHGLPPVAALKMERLRQIHEQRVFLKDVDHSGNSGQ